MHQSLSLDNCFSKLVDSPQSSQLSFCTLFAAVSQIDEPEVQNFLLSSASPPCGQGEGCHFHRWPWKKWGHGYQTSGYGQIVVVWRTRCFHQLASFVLEKFHNSLLVALRRTREETSLNEAMSVDLSRYIARDWRRMSRISLSSTLVKPPERAINP